MPGQRTRQTGRIPLAVQTISLSNSTAVSVNSTTQTADFLLISVETQAARMRSDGTDPALTTGVLLTTGVHELDGYNGTSVLTFQRSTGTCVVTIQPYKYDA